MDALVLVLAALSVVGWFLLSSQPFRGSRVQFGLGATLFAYGWWRTHLVRKVARSRGPLHRLQDWDGPQR
jgi:hypothetical protein